MRVSYPPMMLVYTTFLFIFSPPHFQHFFNDRCHVVIFIFCQTTAEDDVALLLCHFLVSLKHSDVLFVVDGVVWFHTFFPFYGVFAADDGLRILLYVGGEGLEVLVLNDAGVGNGCVRIVDLSQSLIVGRVKDLMLKPYGAVLQLAKAVVIELVNLTGEHNFVELRIEN